MKRTKGKVTVGFVLLLLATAGLFANADADAAVTWYVSQATGVDNSGLSNPCDPTLVFAVIQQALDCASANTGQNIVSIDGLDADCGGHRCYQYYLSSTITISKGGPVLLVGTGDTPTLDGGGKIQVINNSLKAQGGLEIRNRFIAGGFGINGGGIYNASGAKLTLTNDVVIRNRASAGGGIYNDGSLEIDGGSVSTNTAFGHATSDTCKAIDPVSGWIARGGGIYNTGSLTIVGAAIGSNVATTAGNASTSAGCADGGGIFNDGGSVVVSARSTVDLNSAIAGFDATGNVGSGMGSAGAGGIMNFAGGTLTVDNSSVDANDVQCNSLQCGVGGGIVNLETLNLQNNARITGNSGSPTLQGGGVFNSNDSPTFIYAPVTISGNTASEGGGIYNYGLIASTSSQHGVTFKKTTQGKIITLTDNVPDQCGPQANADTYSYSGATTVKIVSGVQVPITCPSP